MRPRCSCGKRSIAHLDELVDIPPDELRRSRRAKFRSMGVLARV